MPPSTTQRSWLAQCSRLAQRRRPLPKRRWLYSTRVVIYLGLNTPELLDIRSSLVADAHSV
jgi:hypothetical protein